MADGDPEPPDEEEDEEPVFREVAWIVGAVGFYIPDVCA